MQIVHSISKRFDKILIKRVRRCVQVLQFKNAFGDNRSVFVLESGPFNLFSRWQSVKPQAKSKCYFRMHFNCRANWHTLVVVCLCLCARVPVIERLTAKWECMELRRVGAHSVRWHLLQINLITFSACAHLNIFTIARTHAPIQYTQYIRSDHISHLFYWLYGNYFAIMKRPERNKFVWYIFIGRKNVCAHDDYDYVWCTRIVVAYGNNNKPRTPSPQMS